MTTELTLVHRAPNQDNLQTLLRQGVPPLLASLYAARGVSDAKEVTMTSADLLPVSNLKNATAMGSLLTDCVVDQKRVLIVSDYDCDGATSASVLIEAFRSCGMNHNYLVPDRLKHGYGLTPSIIDEAALLIPKPEFIITVDNGISSNAGVERARHHGIEVLVTDHHLCPAVLPNARLIVNPQQPGDDFASKHIAGCGVAWYVAKSLHEEMTRRGMEPGFEPLELTPYVALGTVADVVILEPNNRILILEGLQRIRRGDCAPGILALAHVSKKNPEMLTCTDIGFGLGPRINAAGRMAHMSSGIECLTTHDHSHAMDLAVKLDEINTVRRELQKGMAEEAEVKAKDLGALDDTKMSLVVFADDWHEGVVGIVASRIKEDHNRPTFVMCRGQDGSIKGSGRSIDGFHMKHALDEINISHPGILQKFGGHAMAAGATIDPDRLEEFRAAFESICKAHITPAMLERKLLHDGALPSRHLNVDDIRHMDLQVWGQGFAPPVFMDEFRVLGHRLMGEEKNHLKLSVAKDGARLDVVAFGEGERAKKLPTALALVYQPSLNEWNGNVTVQLMARHFASAPGLDAEMLAEARAKVQKEQKLASDKAQAAGSEKAAQPIPMKTGEVASRFSAMIEKQRQRGPSLPTAPSSPSIHSTTTTPSSSARPAVLSAPSVEASLASTEELPEGLEPENSKSGGRMKFNFRR